MKRIIYLSEDEETALRLLSKGYNSHVVRDKCTLPLAGMAVFTQEIRRKTGIRDTKYPRECHLYLQRVEAALDNPPPSKDDLRVLRFYVDGHTFTAMAAEWQTSEAEIAQRVETILAHIGIFTTDERARRLQVRLYLVSFHAPVLPETPFEWRLVRLMADGLSFMEISEQMGERVEYIKHVARGVCTRLGILAKGRDVQRKLIRAFLATHSEPQSPAQPASTNAMDDPMF